VTVGELIRELEGQDPSTEVRLAMQPSWPFEYSVQNVAVVEDDRYVSLWVRDDLHTYLVARDGEDGKVCDDGNEYATHEEAERALEASKPEPVVYLYEGAQLGYLPSHARGGWR
jgi:hypothetical protein